MEKGTLYLIPCPIAETPPETVLPQENMRILASLDYFIVENVRSARRFISSCKTGVAIDSLEFAELNEHTRPEDLAGLVKPLLNGRNVGVISEAGVPGVADPGAEVAALCHRHGIRVVPLAGPSSIIMALMASGLNGQSFAFNGYLPVKPPERMKAIRAFEKRAQAERQSQIFIETPYRNLKLFDDLLSACAPHTRLCVACDVTGEEEFIRTAAIKEWRSLPKPDINKRPAIFIIL